MKFGLHNPNVTEQLKVIAVTVPQAVDVVTRFQDAGAQMLISSMHRNDTETLELLAHKVIPQFA